MDSEEVGGACIERARSLGIRLIAARRGLSGGGGIDVPGSPRDVVRAARAAPDMRFLIYHSGWEERGDENHPFDPNDPTLGRPLASRSSDEPPKLKVPPSTMVCETPRRSSIPLKVTMNGCSRRRVIWPRCPCRSYIFRTMRNARWPVGATPRDRRDAVLVC